MLLERLDLSLGLKRSDGLEQHRPHLLSKLPQTTSSEGPQTVDRGASVVYARAFMMLLEGVPTMSCWAFRRRFLATMVFK